MSIRNDANFIIERAITSAMPDEAVRKALAAVELPDKVYLVAIGKAGAQMAKAAYAQLGDKIQQGIAITKYDHSDGDIGPIKVYEAGHPVLDENSVKATDQVLNMVKGLSEKDTVVFLVSGGGSALFESPLVSLEELQDINKQLLACGADIVEMNTIRKRLSAVKGGKFAAACAPARIVSVILSDIIGDPLDMIASGPAYPDASTCEDAIAIVEKYDLDLSVDALELLHQETPDKLDNVETYVTGSVRQLCAAASEAAQELGYKPVVLTASLCCEAKDAGSFLASIAQFHKDTDESLAFIAGGETVVRLTGEGLGGRNQELALSAACGIAGLENTAVFSVGSDGTDGPTDAAGGYVDGDTAPALEKLGVSIPAVLRANDSYYALRNVDGLVITGPTGTNVNDVCCLLIKR
ncbi:MAG: glycerate kinase [Clostridia bacterium]|nr:glycerate kinase [Clostridia bacterium]